MKDNGKLEHFEFIDGSTAVHLFAFFGLDLPQVELKLLALKDVAVCSAALTRSGGNTSCKRVVKPKLSQNFLRG